MSSAKSDVLYVKFKRDSVFTVSRKRVDSIANFFQQDATFVTHFALARLAEDIECGRYSKPSDIPVGTRAPTSKEWDKLAARSAAASSARSFKPTQTIEQVWGIKTK
ncbi:MAG: hypothetical protein ACKVQK_22820 [Burkholderiales bacterium]